MRPYLSNKFIRRQHIGSRRSHTTRTSLVLISDLAVIVATPPSENEPVQYSFRLPSLPLNSREKLRLILRAYNKPLTMKSETCTSPLRFDIFVPSLLRSNGTWAYWGGLYDKAAYISRCSRKDDSHSCFISSRL